MQLNKPCLPETKHEVRRNFIFSATPNKMAHFPTTQPSCSIFSYLPLSCAHGSTGVEVRLARTCLWAGQVNVTWHIIYITTVLHIQQKQHTPSNITSHLITLNSHHFQPQNLKLQGIKIFEVTITFPRTQRNFAISYWFGAIGQSRLSSSGIFPITISYACCRAHVGRLTAFLSYAKQAGV